MQSCLGIYIQDNLIKYAKVSKDRNDFKVEAYGIKFYDEDIEKAIEQIVKETYSFQTPISVNINKEKYTYSDIFALLKQQDLKKAIDTEFEFFCNNNNQNKNTLECRSLKGVNLEDRDKIRVIYSYIDKTSIVERIQLFDKYRVQNISPIAPIIPNLNRNIEEENCVIVNIEQDTDITTIVNGKVYQVDKIETGMKDILGLIAEKENSVQRAYEVCKNTTVYTRSSQNLRVEGNEYLDDVITVLLDIIDKTKEIVTKNGVEISSVYVTGMGLIINNIDLLFQESFIDKKCEILVPYFIEKINVKINIKDYIEVNSAISLAVQGLDTSKQDINFTEKKFGIKDIVDILTSDVGKGGKIKAKPEKRKTTLKEVALSELDFWDKALLRLATTLSLLIILYISITYVLSNSINQKIEDTNKIIAESKAEIAEVEKYNTLIKARTSEYQKVVDRIDEANSKISENYSSKNAIPNLLNKIMYNIPKGVQLLSIENSTGKNITIVAQAEEYDQLGYFKAVLEEEGILTNITTTKGVKQGELINITMTAQLPY